MFIMPVLMDFASRLYLNYFTHLFFFFNVGKN